MARRKTKLVTTYLTERSEAKWMRPCVARKLRRAKLKARVTVTREGYIKVWAKDLRDRARIHKALPKIERGCSL